MNKWGQTTFPFLNSPNIQRVKTGLKKPDSITYKIIESGLLHFSETYAFFLAA